VTGVQTCALPISGQGLRTFTGGPRSSLTSIGMNWRCLMSVDRFGFEDDSFYGDEDGELLAFPELRRDHMYCKHGNYIGTPYGADYMCHWCEMGEEPEVLTY